MYIYAVVLVGSTVMVIGNIVEREEEESGAESHHQVTVHLTSSTEMK